MQKSSRTLNSEEFVEKSHNPDLHSEKGSHLCFHYHITHPSCSELHCQCFLINWQWQCWFAEGDRDKSVKKKYVFFSVLLLCFVLKAGEKTKFCAVIPLTNWRYLTTETQREVAYTVMLFSNHEQTVMVTNFNMNSICSALFYLNKCVTFIDSKAVAFSNMNVLNEI